MQSTMAAVRTKNPAIKLAQYANTIEMQDFASTSEYYSLWQATNASDWWLRDAAGQRVRWSTAFASYDVNTTGWSVANSLGQRFAHAKAKHLRDWVTVHMEGAGLDYIMVDQFNPEPLSDGDFRRIGTVQSRKDPVIASEHRKGVMAFVAELRRLNPNTKVMGNGFDFGSAEYKGQLDGQLRECLIGKSWSYETWAGWDTMMGTYRTAFANTKSDKLVIFNTCGATQDPALMRYGLASAMLHDGHYAFTNHSVVPYPKFDEQLAPIGAATEPTPTAPTASGVWMRRYQNGIVLVNGTKGPLTINVGAGYKNVLGTVDTVVNNGQVVQTVTLPARSGRLLVKQ